MKIRSIQIAIIIGAAFSLVFSSCHLIEQSQLSDTIVARVYDEELTKSELNKMLEGAYNPSDSANVAEFYINQWIKRQLWVYEAKNNSTIDHNIINQRVQDYKEQLLLNEYQRKYLSQTVDSVVTDQEVEAYYNTNKNNFTAQKMYVRAILIKAYSNTKEVKKVVNRLYVPNEENRQELKAFCINSAESCHLDDSTWVAAETLFQQTPFEDELGNLKTDYVYRKKQGDYDYVFRLFEIIPINGIAPLSVSEKSIRKLIMTRRESELKKTQSQNLQNTAIRNNEIELNY